jgi:hypothetical protein
MNHLPLLALMVACGPRAEERLDAQKYNEALGPLLADNGLLADVLWQSADTLYASLAANPSTGTPAATDPKAIFKTWTDDITPLAAHLRDQAALVQPPDAWLDAHGELVDAWGRRADSYRDIGEALIQNDTAALAAARDAADQSKHLEEQWFRRVNTRLAPYGLHLNQYARPPQP